MHSRKAVPIIDLMNAANMELIRLDFKSSTLSRHSKEFRDFSNYCRENEITAYDTETGPQYFQHRYGLDGMVILAGLDGEGDGDLAIFWVPGVTECRFDQHCFLPFC